MEIKRAKLSVVQKKTKTIISNTFIKLAEMLNKISFLKNKNLRRSLFMLRELKNGELLLIFTRRKTKEN